MANTPIQPELLQSSNGRSITFVYSACIVAITPQNSTFHIKTQGQETRDKVQGTRGKKQDVVVLGLCDDLIDSCLQKCSDGL